jgi:RHS repeat-associated protein
VCRTLRISGCGFFFQVVARRGAPASSPYATGYGYNVASQMTGFKYGNGIYASLGFSPDRLQLNCLDYSTTNRNGTCAHDSTTKFGLGYSYGTTGSNNGLITSITDSVDNGRTVAYNYDPISRLSTAVTTGSSNYPQWGLSWGYDRYGNRLNQTLTAGSGYQGSVQVTQSSNRINCIGGSGQYCTGGVVPTYDANGNMTYDGTNTLVFDAENHATSATNQSTVPSGDLTIVLSSSGNQADFDNVQLSGPSVFYYVEDMLGTSRVMTTSTGVVCYDADFYPYGGERTPYTDTCTQNNYKFTGKERDSESGLDNFGARYNSSSLGRWMSPDAINLTDERVLNPADTLNKYIYGGNNPLKYIDPDGRDITVFYTNTGFAGHFWLVAYDQSTGNSAVMNFGPRDEDAGARVQEGLGIAVPGDTNFGSHITSADELKQDFTSLTIQTNPEDAQKAIQAINSFNGDPHQFMTYSQNCTTVCRDVLHKILKLDSTSIKPVSLWGEIYKKWSNAALNQRPGSKPPNIQSRHGTDYGRPRYGMNTFDFAWFLLHPQKACVTTLAPDGKGGVKSVTTCS